MKVSVDFRWGSRPVGGASLDKPLFLAVFFTPSGTLSNPSRSKNSF
jgi:hypothetical protein